MRSAPAWPPASASETGCASRLAHAYERWDGRGAPAGLAGDDVPVAVRVVTVARDVELWSRRADWPATTAVLSQRRGRAYDPAVVDALLADGERWLAEAGDDVGAMVLDAEPTPVVTIGDVGSRRGAGRHRRFH